MARQGATRGAARRDARHGATRPERGGARADPRGRKLVGRCPAQGVRRGTLGQSLLAAPGSKRNKTRWEISYHQAATHRTAGLKVFVNEDKKKLTSRR